MFNTFCTRTDIKKLGDFNTVKVYNGLTVKLQKSSKSKIEITGSQAEDVTVKNSNGVLKIRLKFPEGFTEEGLKITLYYTNNIDILDITPTILNELNIKIPEDITGNIIGLRQ